MIPKESPAMSITVEAIYENGALKLERPVPLQEQEKVRVTIEPQLSWAERTAAMLKWPGDFEDLRRIVEDDEFGVRESR
jgi:predicted DNA-binding antitoxin AbrB/MazE fold protein